MVVIAMVNMILLLLGFFIGLRKKKSDAEAPATLHPFRKAEGRGESATELATRGSNEEPLIRPETKHALEQLTQATQVG